MTRRVVVDGKSLGGQPTGVGRTLAGVLRGVAELDAGDVTIDVVTPPAGARTLPWVQLELPRRARGAAVLHCPFYYRPLLAPCPTVVVVHDLLVLTHSDWFPLRGRHPFAELLRWSARRAAMVITPSRCIREEVVERLGVDGGRVVAIPWGVDPDLFRIADEDEIAAVRARRAVEAPYLLHVGSVHRRRGLDTAAAALAALVPRWPDLTLAVVGRQEGAWGAVPEAMRHRVRLLGYLPDAELPPLMGGAVALLALSRGEGFDLPLLEALACGAPVVASDIPVHREHFADWARLVPRGDAEAAAAAVAALLAEPPTSDQRASQAAAVARRFRWADTARAHLDLWRHVAGGAR